MSSKKTDYVNAQFDNAEANIQALFDEINRDINGAEISSNYFNGNGYANFVLVYKKGNTVNMVAACLLNTGHGYGNYTTIDAAYEWGIPPQRYYVESRMTVGGQSYYKSFEVYPYESGGVKRIQWYMYNSGSYLDHYVGPAGPMVIRASWRA